MKKFIFSILFITVFISISAQGIRAEMLNDLEKREPGKQDQTISAKLKSASRLFGAKDDLTTVIMIVPSGSVVKVTGSDSAYLKIVYDDTEGYIFRKDVTLVEGLTITEPVVRQQNIREDEPREKQYSRFTYLENKYGTNMAVKLNSGKIWKGMTAQMVRDSWGTPGKINRVESDNTGREEWIYRNTWLYIENNTLVEWGPIRK